MKNTCPGTYLYTKTLRNILLCFTEGPQLMCKCVICKRFADHSKVKFFF